MIVASLGLIIFMFIVGLELNLSLLRVKGRTATGIRLLSRVLRSPLAWDWHCGRTAPMRQRRAVTSTCCHSRFSSGRPCQ